MLQDPFGDPFRLGAGSSMSEIFRHRGGGARPSRKPEAAAESGNEPEPAGPEEEGPTEEEATEDKVILKNPRWETEKVGFNEETDISVEAELPESQSHKTKVAFELFAKTPAGEESISKADGNIQGGKAVARIPVYIPQFKDEEGNFLPEVDYYFSAGHSASKLLKDDSVVKRVKEMAHLLIDSHILPEATFAPGKSQVPADQAPALKALAERIAEWKADHPEGKLAIFGHADAEGRQDANKKLSERRARCIHAFLIKDAAAWESMAKEEKWEKEEGSGFPAFMEANNPLSLSAKDFDVIDGKAFAGCSEFNQVEAKQGPHAPNRRVAVFLLKSSRNFPIQYPCKQGSLAPCEAQAGRKGARRTAGFSCRFYDKLVVETPVSKEREKLSAAAVEIPDVQFAHDGALPYLHLPGALDADPFAGLNAYAEALVHLSRKPEMAFLIFGHADTSGSEAHNLELSRRRAQAVKALLDQDEKAFVKVAEVEKDGKALEHYLDCFQQAFDWQLDAGSGGEGGDARIRGFQEAFNAEHEGALRVDGQIGPKTWGAVFHLLIEQIGLLIEAKGGNPVSARARYVTEGGGIEACGEKYPIEAVEREGCRSQKNRRVEIAFLPKDRPRPKGRKHIILEPIVIKADKGKPKDPAGVLTGIEAACEHEGGKRVAPPGIDLEIVADPVTGDAILLSPMGEGKVKTRWEVKGWSEDKYSGIGTWKTKVRGFKRPSEQFWIPHFNPHVVQVKATGPDGKEYTKKIKAYPGDKGTVKIGGQNWIKKFEQVMDFFKKYCGSKFELELLRGSLNGSGGFKEAAKRPEVFWGWELEGAFSPLIGGKYRFKANLIAFMNFIPDRVKKHVGELVGFLDFKGGVNLSLAYNRKDIDYQLNDLKFKGIVTVSVGIQASVFKERVVKATVQGASGLSLVSADLYNDKDGAGVEAVLEFPGIMAEGAFEMLDGWITKKYSAELMAKHKFNPLRLGTDTFQ